MDEFDPVDFLIDFAWANGADIATVNAAKNKVKQLRENSIFEVVCWSRLNNRGDLYDPRFCYNPHIDESYLIPLYVNVNEYKEKYGKLSK